MSSAASRVCARPTRTSVRARASEAPAANTGLGHGPRPAPLLAEPWMRAAPGADLPACA